VPLISCCLIQALSPVDWFKGSGFRHESDVTKRIAAHVELNGLEIVYTFAPGIGYGGAEGDAKHVKLFPGTDIIKVKLERTLVMLFSGIGVKLFLK